MTDATLEKIWLSVGPTHGANPLATETRTRAARSAYSIISCPRWSAKSRKAHRYVVDIVVIRVLTAPAP